MSPQRPARDRRGLRPATRRRGRAWAPHLGILDDPPLCVRVPPDEHGDLHCTCGASLILFGSTSSVAEEARSLWRTFHIGDGHANCRARVAWLARKRASAAAACREA